MTKAKPKKTGPKGPTKYKKEMCAKLAAYGKTGQGVVEASQMLGIHKDTFNDWAKKYPEFSVAAKEFKQNSQVWWEKEGRKATFGGVPGFRDATYSLHMRNRFPDDWYEKTVHDNTSSDGSMSMEGLFASINARRAETDASD